MNIEIPRQQLDLSSALAEGDIRVLLMVLVHMTGDERWLEPPYKPKRDVRLIPDPDAGVPGEIQQDIRAAVLKLFANGDPAPVIIDPGNELMLKMMRACLGENVAPEYAPLMREEMGFVAREKRWTHRPVDERLAQQHVLIVGAGVCAIALGVALGRLGIPYTIVEKNDELGGTCTLIAIPAAASIRQTIPIPTPSARAIPGPVTFAGARSCSSISKRSRPNTTSARICGSTPN